MSERRRQHEFLAPKYNVRCTSGRFPPLLPSISVYRSMCVHTLIGNINAQSLTCSAKVSP